MLPEGKGRGNSFKCLKEQKMRNEKMTLDLKSTSLMTSKKKLPKLLKAYIEN